MMTSGGFLSFPDWPLFQHTGSQGGYHAHLVMIPSLQHGIYIGINKSPDDGVRDLVAMYILDRLLSKSQDDVVRDLVAMYILDRLLSK